MFSPALFAPAPSGKIPFFFAIFSKVIGVPNFHPHFSPFFV
jgi:hypothetical protein